MFSLVQEAEQPERDLVAIRVFHIIRKDVGIRYIGNLGIVFVCTAYFDRIFAIDQKITFRLAIFHQMGLRQLVHSKSLADGTDIDRLRRHSVQHITVIHQYLVRFLHLLGIVIVGIEQMQNIRFLQIIEVLQNRIPLQRALNRQTFDIYIVRNRDGQDIDQRFDFASVGYIHPAYARQLIIDDIADGILDGGIIIHGVLELQIIRVITILQVFPEELQRSAFAVYLIG